MVVLGDFVWMAVFTDLVAVNANVFFFISLFVFWLFSKFWLLPFFLQNLARIELKAAHQDRVHSLVPVIQTNQVLYFMRNASVCRYSPFTLLFLVHLASRFSSFSVLRFSLLILASRASTSWWRYFQVWSCGRDGGLRVWKLENGEIKLVHEWQASLPVKSACMMADGMHVCTGSFDGSMFMWEVQVIPLNSRTSIFIFVLFGFWFQQLLFCTDRFT